jgi:hypothetical protein
MKKLTILFVAVALLGLAGMSLAQSDGHQVTVSVASISVIDVDDAAVTLTIDAATPGADPDDADPATSSLTWTANGSATIDKEIDVKMNADISEVSLKVEASGAIAHGTPSYASQVTISTTDQPLITAVNKTRGTCTLTYNASATVDADIADYTRTVTYTIIES